ncbi:hypothetical protein OU800_13640 [Pseudomonas sp. GOM7]|uniref:hypothetical protein n=1 Tax=Pseudomonas sp. GOM7 TaxID=2998079 RepID=UPI00227C107A|nr:hypothetical protein [Pseudomonas sp. GOM7]WAJ40130.1 hypothetical protein OU800_13640 [Pseudomonas sp. GOM7]
MHTLLLAASGKVNQRSGLTKAGRGTKQHQADMGIGRKGCIDPWSCHIETSSCLGRRKFRAQQASSGWILYFIHSLNPFVVVILEQKISASRPHTKQPSALK